MYESQSLPWSYLIMNINDNNNNDTIEIFEIQLSLIITNYFINRYYQICLLADNLIL